MSLVDRLTDDRLELMLAERARMVQDIARLKGLPVEVVETYYGLPPVTGPQMYPCSECTQEWSSPLAAAECCDPMEEDRR